MKKAAALCILQSLLQGTQAIQLEGQAETELESATQAAVESTADAVV